MVRTPSRRRANNAAPERGGAPKSRTFHGREWMEHARERWADLTNATLERLDEAVTREDRRNLMTAIDREVAKVEDSGRGGGRGMTGHDDEEPERRHRDRGGPDRLDDWHPGR
jgi:hypothetical protein